MEKIEIKDFVGIKDISIEIKQINILIGPQASGKSIIAKLLFYFKDLIYEIFYVARTSKEIIDFDINSKNKFKRLFPVSSWGEDYFSIKYTIDGNFIEITRKKINNKKNDFEIEFKYSDIYKQALNTISKLVENVDKKLAKRLKESHDFVASIESKFNAFKLKTIALSWINHNFNRITSFDQLYIPAGRSFYAHLKNSIFIVLSESNTVDPFIANFAKIYDDNKQPVSLEIINDLALENQELSKEINLLNEKILCGKYLQQDGKDYLQLTESRTIDISNSSSGQQETLPLIIIMRRMAFLKPNEGGTSVYIEEPEAHIFPSAQKNIVELISTVYNARKDSLQFFITTHSPYILTAFNNLIQAGILAEDATEEKIEQISQHVPKTRFLSPEEVAVYSLEGGFCKWIIDEETGLIDANIIDEVSNELAIQFDELLDLEE